MATMLVIDENKAVRRTLRAILEAGGHTVHAVHHGCDGVAYCDAHPIDVVCMDLLMPEHEGFKVMRALWALTPSPQIIAIAGKRDAARLRLLEDTATLAAERILRPPLRARDLLTAVPELLAEA